MANDNNRIKKLESELEKLKPELEKAQEQARILEESRRAMLSMLEDLNESRASIEKAKNEWEATFDSISDPLFIHDKEFKIVRANIAYRNAAGIKFKEFIGKPYHEIFPKMDKPFNMCLKALELEEEEEEEFSCPVTNRIFKIRFYPIKDVNGGISIQSIHILEDITEAKKAADNIKQEKEITTHLLMIAEATTHTSDIDKLMGEVTHCSHKIIGGNICLSYLWDKEAKRFKPIKAYGLEQKLIPIFMTETLDEKVEFVKKAMEGKETVIIIEGERLRSLEDRRKNSTSQPHNFPTSAFTWLPDINTLAAIPLVGKEDYLGLIIGVYLGTDLKSAPTFTERYKKIMQGISHQVSTALEQARLYKETVNKSMELFHKIETIQVMHEIDRSILSTLDSKEILEIVTRMIARLIPCDKVTVSLIDKDRQGFIYGAGFGTYIVPKGAFVPFRETTTTKVVKTGRPQYAANLAEVKGLPFLERNLVKEGFISHIRIPLIVKGEVIGVLSVGAKRHSAFTPNDMLTLEKIAGQIGVALENARLLTDLNELFMGTVRSFSIAIDAKSKWTAEIG